MLSRHKFAATIVYSADSGEEQGLYGGKVIAQYAVDHGWKVEANLNNDIVGSPLGGDGQRDANSVRVFPRAPRATKPRNRPATAATTAARSIRPRATSRASCNRWRNATSAISACAWSTAPTATAAAATRSSSCRRVSRGARDRIARGLHAPAPGPAHGKRRALRRYPRPRRFRLPRQRHPAGRDHAGRAGERAGAAGRDQVKGEVDYDTTLSWRPSPGATSYRAWWRDTTAPQWQHARDAGAATSIVLRASTSTTGSSACPRWARTAGKARSRSPGSPAASAVRRRPCPIQRRSEVASDGQDTIGSLKASGSSLKSPIGTHEQNTFLSP